MDRAADLCGDSAVNVWWLGFNLKKWWTSSIGMMIDIPNMNGKMPNWWQPNHQPDIHSVSSSICEDVDVASKKMCNCCVDFLSRRDHHDLTWLPKKHPIFWSMALSQNGAFYILAKPWALVGPTSTLPPYSCSWTHIISFALSSPNLDLLCALSQ